MERLRLLLVAPAGELLAAREQLQHHDLSAVVTPHAAIQLAKESRYFNAALVSYALAEGYDPVKHGERREVPMGIPLAIVLLRLGVPMAAVVQQPGGHTFDASEIAEELDGSVIRIDRRPMLITTVPRLESGLDWGLALQNLLNFRK